MQDILPHAVDDKVGVLEGGQNMIQYGIDNTVHIVLEGNDMAEAVQVSSS